MTLLLCCHKFIAFLAARACVESECLQWREAGCDDVAWVTSLTLMLVAPGVWWTSFWPKPTIRSEVDLCSQVYTLAIVAQLQRGAEPKANQDLTIMVPPYDPARIFRLSYEPDSLDSLDELDMEPDRFVMPLRARHAAFTSLKLTSVGLCDQCLRRAAIAPLAHNLPHCLPAAHLPSPLGS